MIGHLIICRQRLVRHEEFSLIIDGELACLDSTDRIVEESMNNEQESKNDSEKNKVSKEKTSGFLIPDEEEEEEPGWKNNPSKHLRISSFEFSQIK